MSDQARTKLSDGAKRTEGPRLHHHQQLLQPLLLAPASLQRALRALSWTGSHHTQGKQR